MEKATIELLQEQMKKETWDQRGNITKSARWGDREKEEKMLESDDRSKGQGESENNEDHVKQQRQVNNCMGETNMQDKPQDYKQEKPSDDKRWLQSTEDCNATLLHELDQINFDQSRGEGVVGVLEKYKEHVETIVANTSREQERMEHEATTEATKSREEHTKQLTSREEHTKQLTEYAPHSSPNTKLHDIVSHKVTDTEILGALRESNYTEEEKGIEIDKNNLKKIAREANISPKALEKNV
ncbi:hypothetical protein K7X08_035721 [Anisodus acutangulus]|uniref:Uncharacterized protein n=1 Tax=Anisodus acutangulus TaxID=402998 RepID=A0A9Q1M667_9SOLA|nr:hypothetical protein K7X08_035721 [Anisodus acutangulus]